MSSNSSAGSPERSARARYPPMNMSLEDEPEFMVEYLDSFAEYSDGNPDDDQTPSPTQQENCPIQGESGRGEKVTKNHRKIKKPRMNRTGIFTAQEKKKLAAEVKSRPVIWEISHPDHHNQRAVSLAWKQIGNALDHMPSNCKTTWIAMKESLRYRKNRDQKKSGSAGGDPLPGPSTCSVDWEFAEDLAFLPDTSRKRKTFTKGDAPNAKQKQNPIQNEYQTEETEVEVERSGNESFRSNYFYQSQPSHSTKSKEDDSYGHLASNIHSLVEISKTICNSPPADENPMVNKTALANIDRMLQKLPANVVEDTLFEMTSLVYAKIKDPRYNNNN